MAAADLIVGIAAVLAGLASLVRQGVPTRARWRLWLATWTEAAVLAAVVTLALCRHSALLDTPLGVVGVFSAWELALSVLSLRCVARRRSCRWG